MRTSQVTGNVPAPPVSKDLVMQLVHVLISTNVRATLLNALKTQNVTTRLVAMAVAVLMAIW